MAVHDDSRQVEAAGGGGHADLAELVVQELAHDGTLAHASRPQHGHPVGGDHASRPAPPPRPRRCLGLPRAAYSRGWGLSHRQDQSSLPLLALGPLRPPPGLWKQEVGLVGLPSPPWTYPVLFYLGECHWSCYYCHLGCLPFPRAPIPSIQNLPILPSPFSLPSIPSVGINLS